MSILAGDANLVVEREKGRRHHWGLLGTSALLIGIGLFSIASVDAGRGTAFAPRQMMFAVVGLVVFFVFNRVRLEHLRLLATPLYLLNLALLASVLFAGKTRGMTSRWIDIGPIQFQPSEISKLLLAITLAAYFANRKDRLRDITTYIGAILHIMPILILVYKQPHFGATMALLVMGLVACVSAGVPSKYFPITIGLIAALGAVIWFTPSLMPDYQRGRIESKFQSLVHGQTDPRGSGYQQDQAMLAIGSGGATGSGFFRGDQKAAGVIPEQHNDFIFSVIGEEGGFFGSVLVLAIFGVFFYFVWRRVYESQTIMGRVIAASLFAVLAFHTVVNLAMVLGLGPVVGLWLPFVSYGGTALWMCMGAVGLLDQCE